MPNRRKFSYLKGFLPLSHLDLEHACISWLFSRLCVQVVLGLCECRSLFAKGGLQNCDERCGKLPVSLPSPVLQHPGQPVGLPFQEVLDLIGLLQKVKIVLITLHPNPLHLHQRSPHQAGTFVARQINLQSCLK